MLAATILNAPLAATILNAAQCSAKRVPANVRRLNNRKWRKRYCLVGEHSRALALLNTALISKGNHHTNFGNSQAKGSSNFEWTFVQRPAVWPWPLTIWSEICSYMCKRQPLCQNWQLLSKGVKKYWAGRFKTLYYTSYRRLPSNNQLITCHCLHRSTLDWHSMILF